jgi:type II secretory pathway component GspD/PulD (secretin)
MTRRAMVRTLPAAIIALFAVLASTILAQVVPAVQKKDNPAQPLQVPAAQASPATSGMSPDLADALAQALPADTDAAEHEYEVENLIAEALDDRIDLNVEQMPIRDAFAKLAESTGIPIEVQPGTVGLLPYGSRTTVSATIKDRTLRETLIELLRPIALKFDVEEGRVVIRPTLPLRRVNERTTWKELGLLETLYKEPWSSRLGDTLKFQFRDVFGASHDALRDTLLGLAAQVGSGTAAEALEQATDRYGWTWFPSGEHIIVLPKARQIERLLDKRVSVDYVRKPLHAVLLELAQRAAVPLRVDPGALATVSPQNAEQFTLKTQNTTVREVLELIAGLTGLAYFIEPEGVRISGNVLSSGTTRPADADSIAINTVERMRSSSILGIVSIPIESGPPIQIYIRENDVTPDLKELISTFKAREVARMRKALESITTARP